MIIDFHTHVGKIVNSSVEELLRSMDKAKIDRSVIISGDDVVGLNRLELMDILNMYPHRFYGVIGVSPEKIKTEKKINMLFELLKHNQVLGYKFYVGYEHYYPNDIKNFTACYETHDINYYGNNIYNQHPNGSQEILFDKLEKTNKFAMFHTGDTYCACKKAKLKFAHPLNIDDLATDRPNLKIIMAHLGYPWHRDAAEVMYKNKNVYADVSGFVYGDFTPKDKENFKLMMEEYLRINDNCDRLLLGTDFPISNQLSYIDTLKELGLFEKLNKNNSIII